MSVNQFFPLLAPVFPPQLKRRDRKVKRNKRRVKNKKAFAVTDQTDRINSYGALLFIFLLSLADILVLYLQVSLIFISLFFFFFFCVDKTIQNATLRVDS